MSDYGVPEEKISVIPPGINLRRWGSPLRRSTPAKGERQAVRLLFVGGDFRRKGGDLLAKIAGRGEFQRCEFHFVTQGFVGPQRDNFFVHPDLKANSDQLIALYREADLFVLPTRADLTPQAICEAMAMGLPVISTDVGGNADVVIDGETGYLVPVDDEEALAERLGRLIHNPELRTQLGQNAKTLAESKFDLEKNAAAIVEYLKKAAELRPR